MRTASSRPLRLAPVPRAERTSEIDELLVRATKSPERDVNIYSTLVRRPELYSSWLDLAHGLLFHGKLSDRDRELIVLRTAWNCDAEYEWAHHVAFARKAGVTEDEIIAIENGAQDPVWDDRSVALLRAADELHDRCTVEDATWDRLAVYFDEDLLYEITMVIGVYHLVAMMLNTFGVQLDPGLEGRPAR